jgi:hypothetical protein
MPGVGQAGGASRRFRPIGVVREEFSAVMDGMKVFEF